LLGVFREIRDYIAGRLERITFRDLIASTRSSGGASAPGKKGRQPAE
jgi:hypothetical protein